MDKAIDLKSIHKKEYLRLTQNHSEKIRAGSCKDLTLTRAMIEVDVKRGIGALAYMVLPKIRQNAALNFGKKAAGLQQMPN